MTDVSYDIYRECVKENRWYWQGKVQQKMCVFLASCYIDPCHIHIPQDVYLVNILLLELYLSSLLLSLERNRCRFIVSVRQLNTFEMFLIWSFDRTEIKMNIWISHIRNKWKQFHYTLGREIHFITKHNNKINIKTKHIKIMQRNSHPLD
jgi:hypothetical protein